MARFRGAVQTPEALWYARAVDDGGVQAGRREVLIQAGLVLASELSLPAVLQKIIDLASQVADARYGALGVINSEGTKLVDFITYGVSDEERRAIGDLPHGEGILGVLIHEAHPLRLHRIQSDERSVGFPPNHPPMTTFLGVPLKVRGEVFGNLYLTEKRGGGDFTEEDEEAVQVLATQAAVAIENARLHEQLQRFAIQEDRERIAADLHDGVIQALFAVGMSLQAASAVAGDAEAVTTRLEGAVERIDEAIRDLRNYIFALRPGEAADRQVDKALRELARSFAEGSEVVIVPDIDERVAARLSGRASDLLQAAREALSNAVRHAQAHTISLRLAGHAVGAVLEIEDDGTGFDPAAVAGQGDGLGNLLARAAALGGELEILPGQPGTIVRITILSL